MESLTVPNVSTTTALTTGWTSGDYTIGTSVANATYGTVGTTTSGASTPVTLHWADMKPTGNGGMEIYQDTDIYVDGTIDMKNTQALTIKTDAAGKPYTVRIYQTSGDITINGQAIAGTGSAKNFQIYSTTTGTIKFNGGSTVYAAVNAPKALFTNNGGNELYGSVIASKMKLSGNAYFHYDADLANLTTPEPKFKIVSWRGDGELNSRADSGLVEGNKRARGGR